MDPSLSINTIQWNFVKETDLPQLLQLEKWAKSWSLPAFGPSKAVHAKHVQGPGPDDEHPH